jgi:hypothetical protein
MTLESDGRPDCLSAAARQIDRVTSYKLPILLNQIPFARNAAMRAPQRGAVAGQTLPEFMQNS